jgi:hypothetical protein
MRGQIDLLTERVLGAVFEVAYKGHSVGEYFADILVEDVLAIG